jgi:hypothetical protein
LWNEAIRAQVNEALESAEGLTVDEIVKRFPPTIPPEKAWDIAARDKVREYLGRKNAYSVFLKANRERRAYRIAEKMHPSELEQVEDKCLIETGRYFEVRRRIRKIREYLQELAKSPQQTVVNKEEFIAEQEREIQRAMSQSEENATAQI